MYEAFYRLANDPFRLLPDPGICFPHRSCAKAWAYLRYAMQRGEGIVVVTGPPGSGKTTIAERLLKELNPARTVSVRLIANDLNATDLLRKLAYSFGLPAEGMDRAMLAHRIERYLIELEHGQRRALVLIDEAQTLSQQALEAMRLLTDLQSRSRPVLQLFLLGQEELEGVMCAPGMTQFQQRVIASSRLDTMDLTETKAYLEYRLGFADWTGDPSIDGAAVMAIYRHSQGLPRHINKICSRLLLHGCTEEKHALAEQDVLAVVQDLRDELLAPINGEREAEPTLAGSAFQSVYELALVPGARSPKIAEPRLQEVGNTPSQAHEKVQPAAVAPPDQVGKDARGEGGPQGSPQRSFHGSGYSHPHQSLRPLYRMLRIPVVLARKSWTEMVRGASLLRDSLTRTGPGDAAPAGDEAQGSHPSRTRVLPQFVPGPVVAGLGVLLVSVLALGVWNIASNSDPSLADKTRAGAGPGSVPARTHRDLDVVDLAADPSELVGWGLLDVSVYREVVASQPLATGENGLLLNAERTAPEGAGNNGLLAYLGGIDLGQGNLVAGKLNGDAADVLVGWVAPAGYNLDNWALTRSPQMDWTLAGVRADPDSGSVVGVPRKDVSAADTDAAAAAAGASSEATDDVPTASPGELLAGAEPGEPALSEQQQAPREPVVIRPAAGIGPSTSDTAITMPVSEVAPDLITAENEKSPEPDGSGQASTPEKAVEVQNLLALAAAAMEKDQLTLPAGGSAYGYFREVLEIDAENASARKGIDDIVNRYAGLAGRALKQQALDRAGLFVGRALRIEPANPRLLALRDEVQDAIAEAEAAELAAAEEARLALEMRRAAPTVEPEVDEESNFSRLMRFVDGFRADSGN